MADVEIHAETLNLTLQTGTGTEDMAELKGLIMSQSSQIAEVRTLVVDAFEDFDARVDRLQAAIDNPDDASNLSEAAQLELTAIKDAVSTLRTRVEKPLTDENADGVPAPAPGTPEVP